MIWQRRRPATVERHWVEPQGTAPVPRRRGAIQLPAVIVSADFCAGQDAYCCTHGVDHRTSVTAIESRDGMSADLVVASASVEAA